MAKQVQQLTTLRVAKAKKPGLYLDGAGLYLRVGRTGSKSWVLRFMLAGKAREMGLGGVAEVGLGNARKKAADKRLLLSEGIDPIEHRRGVQQERTAAVKLAAARSKTFDECADAYMRDHKNTWRNPKHRQQWHNTLATYVSPVFGAVPVQDVDVALVVKALEPIWQEKSETANRLRGRIETVLDSAKARGFRSGENPARWKGHLDKILPAKVKVRKVEHHPALPYVNISRFVADLLGRPSSSALALEFLILTAARTGAVIGATWDEIKIGEKLWTVSPQRAGAKIRDDDPRRIPLCDRAIEILQSVPREEGNPHVFIGGNRGRGLSNMAMSQLMRGMAYPSTTPGRLAVPHGMRTTFKTWCRDRTNYQDHLSKAALWHVEGDKVEAAYARSDMLDKRRRLMDAWAEYCGGVDFGADDTVVPMRAGAIG